MQKLILLLRETDFTELLHVSHCSVSAAHLEKSANKCCQLESILYYFIILIFIPNMSSYTTAIQLVVATTAVHLLLKRRRQVSIAEAKKRAESSKALSKLGAFFRGRKTKKETDRMKKKHLKNRDPSYMAPYNPSVNDVIDTALDMLNINNSHTLWDLGCGDGRMVVEACVRYGCMGCGVEYDKSLCESSIERAKKNGVEHSVSILHENIMNVDFSSARRMYLFLLPDGLKQLTNRLKQVLLNTDARIVTYAFSILALKPIEIRDHKGTKLYLYTAESIV